MKSTNVEKQQTGCLGDIAEIVMGQSPAGKTCNELGEGLPLLNGPTEFGPHHPTPVQYTIDSRKKAKPGDILFCVRGSTTGRMNWADREYAIGRGIAAIRHKRGKEHQHFLRGLIDYRLPELLALATGSTFPNVSYDQLAGLSWEVLTVEEQRAIAQILGALDDKIELNRQMNETLENLAQALFKSWFVDATKDGIPKGWRIARLDELCEIGRGSSPRPIHDFVGGEIPWIKIADSTAAAGPFIFKTREFVTKEGSNRSVWVHPGDLILSNSATCGVPNFVDLDGCIHDGWLHFKNLKHISKHYLFHVLKDISEHLVHIADGSVQKNLNIALVGGQMILVPDEQKLKAFDEAVVPMFEKILHNGRESRTLAALRDALLPKLLSGEVRVSQIKG